MHVATGLPGVAFDGLRATILVVLAAYLVASSRRRPATGVRGFGWVVAGFVLIAFGSLLDFAVLVAADPASGLPALERPDVSGEPVVRGFLAQGVGSLAGAALIAFGFVRWLPRIDRHVDDLRGEVERRRLLEEDRDFAETKLVQAQRMEAVGLLSAGIAHDFNNVLTVISGQTALLSADLRPHPDAAEAAGESIRQLRDGVQRGASLTRQLLAFSRQDVTVPEVLDPGRLVRELKPMLRRLIGERIELETRIASDVACVFVDPGQLEQALVNLVVNAVHAMPSGGRLVLSVENVRGDAGPSIELSVSDTGTGMTEDVLALAFEPLFTTKAPGHGTGLGLSTVKTILERAGGEILAESRPGAGTVMRIRLPAVEDSVETPTSTVLVRARPGQGETVLLCEDEPSLRSTLHEVLTRSGYRVIDFESADDALSIDDARLATVDVLLTDLVMPGSTHGMDLVRALRKHRDGLSVVMMTGYARTLLGEEARVDASIRLLPKPFSEDALLVALQSVLAGDPPPSA